MPKYHRTHSTIEPRNTTTRANSKLIERMSSHHRTKETSLVLLPVVVGRGDVSEGDSCEGERGETK